MMQLKPVRRTPPNELLAYLPRWQTNTVPKDKNKLVENPYRYLGAVRFIFDMYRLQKQVSVIPLYRDFVPKYGVAPWASEALGDYLYYEPGMEKEDRCHVFATFREGSKTFWFAFALGLYETLIGQYGIYFNDYLIPEVDYQIIKCKSATEARKRLMTFSSTLNREIIGRLFGELKPTFKEVKSKDAKDTDDLLILSNGYIFQASGIDQPIRGSNIQNARPKKITFDDPQNRENTKTPERRRECDREVMEESFGALADNGILVFIGNKIHEDDTLGKLLRPSNKQWKKKFFTLTVRKVDGKILPGIGDLDNEEPAWKARWTIEKVRKRMKWFEGQPELGGLRGFMKEYYNRIQSDIDYKILEHNAEYLYKYGVNWLVFDTPTGKEYRNVHIAVGLDPAISKKKTSSDAVVSVVARDWEGKRYLLDIEGGKWNQFDEYYDNSYKPKNPIALTAEEQANIRVIGSTEQVVRKFLQYHADSIVIETFGQQGTFFEGVCKILNEQFHIFPTIYPYAKPIEKVQKLAEGLLIYFEKGIFFIKESHIQLKNEIQTFPDSKLDWLDATYLAEQGGRTPEKINYSPLGLPSETQEESYTIEEQQFAKPGRLLNEFESWII